MNAEKGIRLTAFGRLRVSARRRLMRQFLWALFWAVLAFVTLSLFRLGQVRLQPDAIACGVPGFLFRLVIRPFEWAMNAVVIVDPALLGLQAAALVAICTVIAGYRSYFVAR